MVDLVRGFEQIGHEALVLVPENGPLQGMLAQYGLQYRTGRARPWIGTSSRFRYLRRHLTTLLGAKAAVKGLRDSGFDLVYTNTITSPFGALIARDLVLPHVWQVRENLPKPREAGPPGAYEKARRTFRELSTLSLGISQHIAQQVAEWAGPEKTRLVYIGPLDDGEADRTVVKRVSPGPPYQILMVGRINALKRQEDAVKALAILKSGGLDARLTLVGRSYGSRDEYLKGLAQQLGVSEAVRIIGYVDDPRSLYEESHVSINCSEAEPLGRTILEGMAFGCTTVAANGGGPTEVITDGVDGLLFKPTDPEDLARCLRSVLEDASISGALALAARDRVLPFFTRSRYVEDMLQVFEEAMRSGRPAPSPKMEAVPREV